MRTKCSVTGKKPRKMAGDGQYQDAGQLFPEMEQLTLEARDAFRLDRPKSYALPRLSRQTPARKISPVERFARERDEFLGIHNRALPPEELRGDLKKMAGLFRQDKLLRQHADFYALYQTALLELSRFDLFLSAGPEARAGMADRSLAAFWRGYFQLNPLEKADGFAALKTDEALKLFIADQELFNGETAPLWDEENRTALFYKTRDFFIGKGYLTFPGQDGDAFALSAGILTRVLRQFCWFVKNFYQANQNSYTYTPPLSCETVNRADDPASLLVTRVAAKNREDKHDIRQWQQ